MFKSSPLVLGAALLVGLAACESSTGLPTEFSQADAIQLAADMDAVASLQGVDVGIPPSLSISVGSGEASASAAVPVPINNSFTVTKQCPRGGQVALAGTVVGTFEQGPLANSFTLDANATRTDSDCAFLTRHGVLTVDGNPNITYEGHLNIVNGALVGIQSQTHQGSFTWVRGGGSGTCNVDIMSSFNPATNTATVAGTFCGFNVNVTHTRS
jgi:hypothetical protein